MSGCATTHRVTRSLYRSKAYPLYPPNFAGVTFPILRHRVTNRLTELIENADADSDALLRRFIDTGFSDRFGGCDIDRILFEKLFVFF